MSNGDTFSHVSEQVQMLESRVNNIEPSLSTLHSSLSSMPLEPSENLKRKEGLINEPSSSFIQERPTLRVINTSTGAINILCVSYRVDFKEDTSHGRSIDGDSDSRTPK